MINIKNSVAGRYRIKKFIGDVETLDTGWFDNLIVNNGLDQIANVPGGSFGFPYLFTQAYVGTGTATPAYTDTSLASYLASSGVIEGGTLSFTDTAGTVPAHWSVVKVFTFGTGVATGTLSEVGVGKTNTNLFSRALIVDSAGNPTTITVLSTETLQVTYEYRVYLDKTDGSTTVDISGTIYNVLYRLCDIDVTPVIYMGLGPGGDAGNRMVVYPGSIGTVYTTPSGGGAFATSYINIKPYVVGTYYADLTYTVGLSDGNYGGGILSIEISGRHYHYQMQFTPAIPKNSTNVLTMNFRISWGRYTP